MIETGTHGAWFQNCYCEISTYQFRRSILRADTVKKAHVKGPASISAAGARQRHKITAYPDGFLLVEGICAPIRKQYRNKSQLTLHIGNIPSGEDLATFYDFVATGQTGV